MGNANTLRRRVAISLEKRGAAHALQRRPPHEGSRLVAASVHATGVTRVAIDRRENAGARVGARNEQLARVAFAAVTTAGVALQRRFSTAAATAAGGETGGCNQ